MSRPEKFLLAVMTVVLGATAIFGISDANRVYQENQAVVTAYQAGLIQPCSRREAMTIAVLRERPKPSEPDVNIDNNGPFRNEFDQPDPKPEPTPETVADVPVKQWWPLAGYPGYQIYGAKNADGLVVVEAYYPSQPVVYGGGRYGYGYSQCTTGNCPQ